MRETDEFDGFVSSLEDESQNQACVDRMTVEYHLHIAQEKLERLQHIAPDLAPLAVQDILFHLLILNRRYLHEGRLLLSKPLRDQPDMDGQKNRLIWTVSQIQFYLRTRNIYRRIMAEENPALREGPHSN